MSYFESLTLAFTIETIRQLRCYSLNELKLLPRSIKRYDRNHGVAKCYLSGLGLEVSESDALF